MSTKRKPRTCCDSHGDTCHFGRDHMWFSPWFGGPKSGMGFGEPGRHDTMICPSCRGVCCADVSDDK